MGNVISFPEKKMKRAQRRQKSGAYQATLSLSLVSLMMGALVINDSMNRANLPRYIISDNSSATDIQNLNRAIASAHPMNPFQDLEWEKKLAKRLGQDALEDRTPASIGKAASAIEKLRYGPLAGKYRLMDQANSPTPKVQEISYIESAEVNDRPVYLEPEQFLKDYGSILAIDFSKFDRVISNTSQGQVREYRLLNSSQHVVGTAAFVMDDDSRFLSLKVRSASENHP
jgi:hypothetical protein